MRHDVVNFESRERRGVVAHQQGASFPWAHPLSLLTKGKLQVIYIEHNRAVYQAGLTDCGRPIRQGWSEIGCAKCCERLGRIRRHRRRVLVFTLKRECQRPRFCVGGYARYVIDACPVGSSVVVNDGLSEVIAITKWGTGNSHYSRINRVHACADIRTSVQARDLGGKLV